MVLWADDAFYKHASWSGSSLYPYTDHDKHSFLKSQDQTGNDVMLTISILLKSILDT